MSVFVKICGLRDALDVEAAAGAGADAVGFVFAESPRQVTPGEAVEATAGLPDSILRVAVLRHPNPDAFADMLDQFKPDVVQIDVEDFAELDVPEHISRWPVYREGGVEVEAAETFVYEGPDSGRGATVDWARAADIASRGRMILAGGLAEDNVAAAIAAVRPWGVDVSSGVESLPGCKDHELIRRFVSAVRAAEKDS